MEKKFKKSIDSIFLVAADSMRDLHSSPLQGPAVDRLEKKIVQRTVQELLKVGVSQEDLLENYEQNLRKLDGERGNGRSF